MTPPPADREPARTMPETTSSQSSPSIERQAATWFALMLDEDMRPGQREAWQRWMAADPRHAAAYERLAGLWQDAAELPPMPGAGEATVSARWSRRRLLGWASAASVVLAGGSLALLQQPRGEFHSRVGELRHVRLPDGSTVELAGDSAIRIDFSDSVRRVELLEGEAFFQVAADPLRPFGVEAAGGRSLALGTAFSVSHEAAGVRVIVTEHQVRVDAAGQQVRLDAGQSVRYDRRGLGNLRGVDPQQALAWRQGQLVFFDTPLDEVIEHLQRWRPGTILITDRRLARRPVSLLIDLRRKDGMLDLLGKTLPIHIDRYGPLTLIRPQS